MFLLSPQSRCAQPSSRRDDVRIAQDEVLGMQAATMNPPRRGGTNQPGDFNGVQAIAQGHDRDRSEIPRARTAKENRLTRAPTLAIGRRNDFLARAGALKSLQSQQFVSVFPQFSAAHLVSRPRRFRPKPLADPPRLLNAAAPGDSKPTPASRLQESAEKLNFGLFCNKGTTSVVPIMPME
jgi:hypothetical protein